MRFTSWTRRHASSPVTRIESSSGGEIPALLNAMSTRPNSAAALARAGATATADGTTVTVSGLPPEKVVLLLGENAVPFSEVSAHRASLEEAYLELARDAADYRAAGAGLEAAQ